MLVADITREVVVRVTHRLQLTHDTQHLVYLMFGLVGKPTVRYLVQVVGYLVFHTVADTLVFLHTGEDLRELRIVVLFVQVVNHTCHALGTDGEDMHLFPCLQD